MTSKRMLEKSGLFLFIILTLFSCRSKTIVDISYGLILLIAVYYMIRYAGRGFMAQNRYIIVLLLPLAIGFCTSFFSLSGTVKGAAGFLERYRFFLMIVPFTILIRSKKNIHILFTILNLSAFISVSYGFIQFNPHYIWAQTIGFYDILRQASLLMSIVLINIVVLFSYRIENKTWNIASKILIGVNTVLMMTAVILMNRRSAYLGFVAGAFVSLLVIRKRKLFTLIVFAICAFLYFSNSTAVQRVKSIMDFKGDHSNRERIQLLRTGSAYIIDEGLFFHGTGAKMSYKPFKAYFYSHSPEYQEKNKDIIHMDFFGNYHNSFLQMAIEYGLFFLLCYLASVFYMLFRLYRSIPHLPGSQKVYPMVAIVTTVGFFVSQFFHTNLYSYGGLPFLLAFSAGCSVFNQHRTQVIKTNSEGSANVATQNDGH